MSFKKPSGVYDLPSIMTFKNKLPQDHSKLAVSWLPGFRKSKDENGTDVIFPVICMDVESHFSPLGKNVY